MKRILVVVLVLALLGAGVFFALEFQAPTEPGGSQNLGGPVQEAPEYEDQGPVHLSIVCVGDVMVHKSQIASQYDSRTKTYNYDDNFQYVKKYIEAADLALCNVETTFSGGEPSGYPSFNAPDALATSLAKAGFDVGLTSNNHLHDKGLSGMERTLRVLREAGIATAGSRLPWERN
jgi:poly-gamma-glutamate synthesis protein (capsule biosynthesis protein)